jgi:hypothetical protein
MIEKYKHIIILILFTLLAFLFSLNQLANPMIAEPDAYSRVNVAVANLDKNLFFSYYGGTWLPLHFTIFSFFLSFFNYPSITPRILTLIVSLSTSLLLYKYTKNIYKSKIIALSAGLIYIVLPLRIFLSTQTLSEPMFLFFFLGSLIFLQKNKLSAKDMIISALLLNIAHGIRYESWFSLPLIWFFILGKENTHKQKLAFIVSSTLFPIKWIILNQIYNKGFLSFFNEKYETAKKTKAVYYFDFPLTLKLWEQKIRLALPAVFTFIAMFDYKNLIKSKNTSNIFYYSLAPFFYFVLIFQAYMGTMEWFPTRYLIIPITFLIPMLSASMIRLFTYFKKKLSKNVMVTSVSLLIFFIYIITKYLINFTDVRYELNELSFSGNRNYQILYSEEYLQLSNLIEMCKIICEEELIVYTNDYNRTHLDQALIYFSGRVGYDTKKENIKFKPKKNSIFAWEKEIDLDESKIISKYNILYENDYFYIMR